MRRNPPQGRPSDRVIFVDKDTFVDKHFLVGCALTTLFSCCISIYFIYEYYYG